MKDRLEPGCLVWAIIYGAPVIIMFLFGLTGDAMSALIFSVIIAGVLTVTIFSMFCDGLSNNAQVILFHTCVVGLAAILFIASVNIFHITVFDRQETTQSSRVKATSSTKRDEPSTNALVEYYKENYPMTWGYIKKNTMWPEEYLEYYDSVWGDLQEYLGDGIPFDTLTMYEMSLVNYPNVGPRICIARGGKTYHSTEKCYTLLKTDVKVWVDASRRRIYSPCSKCVGN